MKNLKIVCISIIFTISMMYAESNISDEKAQLLSTTTSNIDHKVNFKSAKIVAGSGLGLFLTGFIGSTIFSTLSSFNYNYANYNVPNTIFSIASLAGPILTCAGETMAFKIVEKNNIAIDDKRSSWRNYGKSWAYTGIAAGFIITAVLIPQTASPVLPIALIVPGISFAITGTVHQFIAAIRPWSMINDMETKGPRFSLSFSPTLSQKTKIGFINALVFKF